MGAVATRADVQGLAYEWIAAPRLSHLSDDHTGKDGDASESPLWGQCHASTIAVVGDELLAAWFGGTREGTPDNRIWMARHTADRGWSKPEPVAGDGSVAHWNPVLAKSPTGDLWLFYKRGARISMWATWVQTSSDGGRSWTPERELVPGDAGGRGPVKNPPIVVDDGVWLAGASTEKWGTDGTVAWNCFIDRSDDGGRTWHKAPIPADQSALRGAGMIQPALWTLAGEAGTLMRSTEGVAYLSTSTDGGRTFSPARPTNLANNNSGLTVVQLRGGALACVHNPVGSSWGSRCPLSISISLDGGSSWRERLVIEDGGTVISGVHPQPAAAQPVPTTASPAGFVPGDDGVITDGIGEYSYPAAALARNELLVTYTWQRQGIVCVRIPLSLLDSLAY